MDGDKGLRSFESSDMYINGRALTIASASQRIVFKLSYDRLAFPSIFRNNVLRIPIILSHQPPHYGAAGGLKYHSICDAELCLAIFSHSNLFKMLAAPVKFVPLSQYIARGRPRLAESA